MIVVAIGIAAIAAVILATFMAYDAGQQRIEHTQEQSNTVQNDRVKEDLEVSYDNGTLTIGNTWGGTSGISGVMIRCENGTTFTAHLDTSINRTGQDVEVRNMIEDLKDRC